MKKILCGFLMFFLLLNHGIEAFAETLTSLTIEAQAPASAISTIETSTQQTTETSTQQTTETTTPSTDNNVTENIGSSSSIEEQSVVYDEIGVTLKDAVLHVGEKWDVAKVWKKGVDYDGTPLTHKDIQVIWINGFVTSAGIDTSKPGKYRIFVKASKITGTSDGYSNSVTVTVKEDETSIKTKDSTLYVGQKWDPKDNFDNATDEDGKSIPWED
ncbi:hypothetical protein F6346_002581, partial [Enterococcus faecalis]|nr:hypothetical protein [Enterococcus faecalis]